jgi:hypothetical protein
MEVHARGEGLDVGVGVACELPPPDEPHAASSIVIATIAPTLMGTSVVADRAYSKSRKARVSCDNRPALAGARKTVDRGGLRSARVALKGFTWLVREAVVAAPA